MRPWMEKWGGAALIFFCALVILFSALYTFREDAGRGNAQRADAGQEETMAAVTVYHPPLDAAPVRGWRGAYQTAGGLWRSDPYVYYDAARGARVYSCCAGVILCADAAQISIRSDSGLVFCLRGSFAPLGEAGARVAAGQAIARTAQAGQVRLSAMRDGQYLDPLSLF